MATYKALRDCHMGRYRKAGEVFQWKKLEPCPAHLQELAGSVAAKAVDTGKAKAPKGPSLADLGAGEVKSVAEVTAADVIKDKAAPAKSGKSQ
jgi:hypothetical protein